MQTGLRSMRVNSKLPACVHHGPPQPSTEPTQGSAQTGARHIPVAGMGRQISDLSVVSYKLQCWACIDFQRSTGG